MDHPIDPTNGPTETEYRIVPPESIELIDDAEGDWSAPPRVPPEQVYRPRLRSRKKLAIILFVATCFTTLLAGMTAGEGMPPTSWLAEHPWKAIEWALSTGIQYAGPLMLILLAHEMGHYLQARRYGVPATLPFFIPMPLTPFGTLGAVIVQGAGFANRKTLFDIAISGPLAGLLIALPVAYYGLQDCQIVEIGPQDQALLYGDPLILQWMIEIVHGPLGPNDQVVLTPMLFAGWVGIFITALNLIPIGQLDGGHILYTLIRRRAHVVATSLLFFAVAYMIWTSYYAYGLMVLLLFLMGPRHPPTADDTVRLGWRRIVLGWLTLAFIVIGFTPTPLTITVPEPQQQRQPLPEPPPDEPLIITQTPPLAESPVLTPEISSFAAGC